MSSLGGISSSRCDWKNWRRSSGVAHFDYSPLTVEVEKIPEPFRSQVEQHCLKQYEKAMLAYDQAIGDAALLYVHKEGAPETREKGPLLQLVEGLSRRYLDLLKIAVAFDQARGIPLIPVEAGMLKRQGFVSTEILQMKNSCEILIKLLKPLKQKLSKPQFETFFRILVDPNKRTEYLQKPNNDPLLLATMAEYEKLKEKTLIDRACLLMIEFDSFPIDEVIDQLAMIGAMRPLPDVCEEIRLQMEIRHRIASCEGYGALGTNPLAYLNLVLHGEMLPEAEFRQRLFFTYQCNHLANAFMQNSQLVSFANKWLQEKGRTWQIDPQFVDAMNKREPTFLPPLFRYGQLAELNRAIRIRSFNRRFYDLHPRPHIHDVMEGRVDLCSSFRHRLSPRELMAQIGDFRSKAVSPHQKVISYSGGASFQIKDNELIENSERGILGKRYLNQCRELKIPFIGSISGTYDQMATMGALVNLTVTQEELEQLRLAMIAFMVPPKDHSVDEILQSSRSFGLSNEVGPGFERSIYPVGGNRFLAHITREQEKRNFNPPAYYLTAENAHQVYLQIAKNYPTCPFN